MLAAGADPKAKDRQGRTASDAAITSHPTDLADPKVVEDWRTIVALVWKDSQARSAKPSGPTQWSLEYSVGHGQTDATQMLLALGQDPNAAGTTGTFPLADAALKGDLGDVRLLLGYGARVDAVSPTGTQPIHDAALGDNPAVIRELASHGAKIDARSRGEAQTPLHFAAAMGRMRAAEVLVTLGADLTIKDSQGRTAVEVAERAGLADVGTFLRNAIAARGVPAVVK